jgi:hypothetical protein
VTDNPADRPPSEPRAGSAAPGLAGLGWSLGIAAVGLALLVGGLGLDAYLHIRNPDLAHQEGVFTLSNPGHLLLFLGLIGVAAGVVTAALRWLRMAGGPQRSRAARRALVACSTVATVVALASMTWAADAESGAEPAGGGHDHAVPAAAGPGHGHDGHGGHDAAMPCGPSAAQMTAAVRLVDNTRRGLARFARLQDARAAGYAPHHNGREAIKHYFNPAYVLDGRVLDPKRPEGLMYAHTERGPVLIAAVWLMNRTGEPGKAVGGCLTVWHEHDNLCSTNPAKGLITGLRSRSRPCPPGQVPWRTPVMLHTWLVDVPGGPFAREIDDGAVFRELGATPRPATR